jgi:hypothetical protein
MIEQRHAHMFKRLVRFPSFPRCFGRDTLSFFSYASHQFFLSKTWQRGELNFKLEIVIGQNGRVGRAAEQSLVLESTPTEKKQTWYKMGSRATVFMVSLLAWQIW